MKYKLNIFTFLLIASIMFLSCSSEEDSEKEIKSESISDITPDTIQIQTIIDTLTSDTLNSEFSEKKQVKIFKYICPVGDKEGNSDIEGICPSCEMELIENPDYKNSK